MGKIFGLLSKLSRVGGLFVFSGVTFIFYSPFLMAEKVFDCRVVLKPREAFETLRTGTILSLQKHVFGLEMIATLNSEPNWNDSEQNSLRPVIVKTSEILSRSSVGDLQKFVMDYLYASHMATKSKTIPGVGSLSAGFISRNFLTLVALLKPEQQKVVSRVLVDHFAHSEWMVRRDAIAGLKGFQNPDASTVLALGKSILEDTEPLVREAGRYALLSLNIRGTQAAPLIDFVLSKTQANPTSADLQNHAALLFSNIGTEFSDVLALLLRPEVLSILKFSIEQYEAGGLPMYLGTAPITLLGQLRATSMTSTLERVLMPSNSRSHAEYNGQREAAQALSRMNTPESLRVLIEATKTQNVLLLNAVLGAIGDTKNPQALPILVAHLKDSSHTRIRSAAAEALGDLGHADAIEPLINALKDGKPNSNSENEFCVDINAAMALGKLGAKQAIQALTDLMKSKKRKAEQQKIKAVLEGLGAAPEIKAKQQARGPSKSSPRYFSVLSGDELKTEINLAWNKHEDFGEDGQVHYKTLTKKIAADLKKVNFNDENTELIGIFTLENGLTFAMIESGGDWEIPLRYIIYWDGKDLRAYIPTEGNPWNTLTREAYGNDEAEDLINAKKRFPNVLVKAPNVKSVTDINPDINWFDETAIDNDIKQRFQAK